MKWETINRLKRICRIGFIRTLYINLSCLPFKQAIKLPILLSRKTYFYDLSGKIEIEGTIRPFMIRFGYFGEDSLVWKDSHTLLKIRGTLIFRGSAHLGIGVCLRVEPGAVVIVGDNVRISNRCKIIAFKKITIGNNCRIAWECQIMDTAFHYIKSIETGTISVRDSQIMIGNNNWIGNRSNIMKGTITPDFCIIAAGSLCNKPYDVPNYCFLAGVPAKLIKAGVYRVLDQEEARIKRELNH
jgi:acetyltransferase-like isoleucine patch superfamily enzyme